MRDGKLESCFGRFKLKQDNIKDKLRVLDEIVSDMDHREMVSAGCCAGIASAFNAPIGGVLFAMEEVSLCPCYGIDSVGAHLSWEPDYPLLGGWALGSANKSFT